MELTIENLRKGDVLKVQLSGHVVYYTFINMFNGKIIVWDQNDNDAGYLLEHLLDDDSITSWMRGDIDMMAIEFCDDCGGNDTGSPLMDSVCPKCKGDGYIIKASEPAELEPYVWSNDDNGYHLSYPGGIISEVWSDALFNFDTEKEAEAFAHKLKIMSVMLNLKKALNDTTETEYEGKGAFVNYCDLPNGNGKWVSTITHVFENQLFPLFTQANSGKVVEYLNKHYPNGWNK